MKRGSVVLFALLGITVSGGAFAAVRWWQMQHTAQVQHFDAPTPPSEPQLIRLQPVVTGLDQPTDIVFVPGGGMKAIVTEQAGRAHLVDIGAALQSGQPIDVKTTPLVLEMWVRSMSEMGLLSLAFHPKYQQNGRFFARYDPWVHDTLIARIAEFELPFAELGKHPATEKRTLVEVPQKVPLHQAGQTIFGPDGKLYIGFGDGGTANDSDRNGQNLNSLKGKILRLDVDAPDLIPKDNPFVGRPEVRPEIWAYGLRNPWRFSFDKEGHAIVGDVGQEGREELDLVSKGDNLGWNVREGSICGQGITDCVKPEMTDPIFEYDRTVGECIIGGETATGTRIAEIQGKYIFADFVRGRIWAIDLPPKAPKAGEAWTPLVPKVLGQWGKLFTSFAHDNDGNLYVTDVVAGEVLALMPAP